MLYSDMSSVIISLPELINEVRWFPVLTFPSLSKIEWFDHIVWSFKWNVFRSAFVLCATDGTKRLIIHLAYLQNSTKILVLGPHLCTRIWVCAIIGLLKKAIVDLPIRLKRNLKCISGNSFSPLETQDKDISTSSYTLMSTTQAMLLYGSIYYAAQGVSDFFKKYDHSNKTSLAVLLLVTI